MRYLGFFYNWEQSNIIWLGKGSAASVNTRKKEGKKERKKEGRQEGRKEERRGGTPCVSFANTSC